MKKVLFFLLVSFAFACKTSVKTPVTSLPLTDNEELAEMYKTDQADRQSGTIDWKVVSKKDSAREARVYELLAADQVKTGRDYYNAAMIFQHGRDTIASGMAVKMMRKAIALDSTVNKWLLAAAIDRDLMRKGEPQIYGTQYTKKSMDAPWELYTIDSTQVTDEERKAYGVETLAQQRAKVRTLNKKKLSEQLAAGKTIDEVVAFAKSEDINASEYDLSESGLNNLGYELMGANNDEAALQIFQLNTELYPKAYNTYDSLGECLVKLGRTQEGIDAYKKSLELNPKNTNAIRVLETLEKD